MPLSSGKHDIMWLQIPPEYLGLAKEFWHGMKEGWFLRATLEKWVEKRSLNQNNIFHSIVRQMAPEIYPEEDIDVGMQLVKDGIKEAAMVNGYPGVIRQSRFGVKTVPKPSRHSDKREMAYLIEEAANEAAFQRIDIREHIISWYEWVEKKNQSRNPLEGTYKSKGDYVERHPSCEACLTWLGSDPDEEGHYAGQVAHIVTKGMRKPDVDWNWLRLCTTDHLMIQHQKGWGALIEKYPIIKAKVRLAQEKANEYFASAA